MLSRLLKVTAICGLVAGCGSGTSTLPSGDACGAGTLFSDGKCFPDSAVVCGAGTAVSNGKCIAATVKTVVCGAGTAESNGSCLPTSTRTCSTGTLENAAGQCVANISGCGTGTSLTGGQCVPNISGCGAGSSLQNGQCVAAIQTCGAGATTVGTACTSTLSCGNGTAIVANQCAVNLGTVCGTDTVASGGTTCVGSLMCGANTTRTGSSCNPNLSTLCSTGTMSSAGLCKLDPAVACGSGTVFQSGRCQVPTAIPSLTTFTAATNLTSAYGDQNYFYMNGTRTYVRLMLTDLSQGNADAWVQSEIKPIGVGAALQLKIDTLDLYANSTQTIAIKNAATNGVCDGSLTPTTLGTPVSSGMYALFWGWNSTVPSLVACAIGGSVKLQRITVTGTGGSDTVKLTFNLQFNDGTVWQDKIFTTPYQ